MLQSGRADISRWMLLRRSRLSCSMAFLIQFDLWNSGVTFLTPYREPWKEDKPTSQFSENVWISCAHSEAQKRRFRMKNYATK